MSEYPDLRGHGSLGKEGSREKGKGMRCWLIGVAAISLLNHPNRYLIEYDRFSSS